VASNPGRKLFQWTHHPYTALAKAMCGELKRRGASSAEIYRPVHELLPDLDALCLEKWGARATETRLAQRADQTVRMNEDKNPRVAPWVEMAKALLVTQQPMSLADVMMRVPAEATAG
jgi:hypothetical protein